jgi:hypothetical protein
MTADEFLCIIGFEGRVGNPKLKRAKHSDD